MSETLLFGIEAYRFLEDKEPLYTFFKDSEYLAYNMAEVLMDGEEVGYVVIVDAKTDTIITEFTKYGDRVQPSLQK